MVGCWLCGGGLAGGGGVGGVGGGGGWLGGGGGAGNCAGEGQARWGALVAPSFDGGTGAPMVASTDEATLSDMLVHRWLLPSVSMHAIAAADAGRDPGVPEEWWGGGGGGWWGGGGDLSRAGSVCRGVGGVGVSAVGGVSVRIVGKMSCAQV